MNRVTAVIGMCGSGKSEAVKFFEENGFAKVYFGSVVIEELKSRGLEVNEKNERYVREDLRREIGMGVMAIKSIEKIKNLLKNQNVVVESLYSWEEFKILKKEFGDTFGLICIYTTKSLRYNRLKERPFRPLTFSEAESRDVSEIENLDKGGPIAFADYTVINDFTLDELKMKLKEYL
jgi:dephospho-CoA kinase